MSEGVANTIGVAAALCSITSFIPQVVKIAKERDASSVSLRTYALTVTCFVLWTIYGFVVGSLPVLMMQSCSCRCGMAAWAIIRASCPAPITPTVRPLAIDELLLGTSLGR